jgi:ABC-2 type transport system ATP-binding protein
VNVIETTGLGKRYGRTWALNDCSLAIPAGHVTALVGHNGAGKTTLLHLSLGLVPPTTGTAAVLGGLPAGSAGALDGIAFVAQDMPLYKGLSVADMLRLTRSLNRQWDQKYAQARLAELGIPLKRKSGKLSGGQQAQVALTLALARRPRLLVLDEPLANLDPLARHDFMGLVMAAVAEEGMSVVLSSHVLAELERVADHIVVMAAGRVQAADEVDGLLAAHRVLTGPAAAAGQPRISTTSRRRSPRRCSARCRCSSGRSQARPSSPGSSTPAPPGSPGPRARGGPGGRSPGWRCPRCRSPSWPRRSASSSRGSTSRSSPRGWMPGWHRSSST